MGPYELDLRRKILEAYEKGEGSIRTLARRFGVAPNTVQNYRTRARSTGSLEPDPHAGGVPSRIDASHLDEVRVLVEEKPDATVAELAKRFWYRAHIRVSRPTMGRVLQALGLTRKKNASCGRARHRTGRRSAPHVRGTPPARAS